MNQPDASRLRVVLMMLVVALSLSLYWLTLQGINERGVDFVMYLTGAAVATSADSGRLYDQAVQAREQKLIMAPDEFKGGLLPFNYPPYIAALFVPLAALPLTTAYYAWAGIQWLLLVGLALGMDRSRPGGGSAWPILLGFFPVMITILMGQLSLVMLALWWLIYRCWASGRWVGLGLALTLASFKPHLAVALGIGLLVERRWRALAAAALGVAGLWGVFLALWGFGNLGGYIEMLRVSGTTVDTLGFYPIAMVSLRGWLATLSVGQQASQWIVYAVWVAGWALLAWVWRTDRPLETRLGTAVVIAVLTSPHLYVHDAILLALPLCFVARRHGGPIMLGCALLAVIYGGVFFGLLPLAAALAAIWLIGGALLRALWLDPIAVPVG